MRVIYHGWAITQYGKGSLSITDPDGREVCHKSDTAPMDEDELKRQLKDYIKKGE